VGISNLRAWRARSNGSARPRAAKVRSVTRVS
jgi:hypothetical protein